MGKVEIENLTYVYPERETPALKNITLKIESGEFILILGKSGCGKSTLLRSINRLIPDFHGGNISGIVKINDKDIYKMKAVDISAKAGMVFQNPENQIIFSEVIKEIVFGMENLNFSYEKMKINLADVTSYLGITNLLNKKTFELSGGEMQKIAIASILCMEPQILLLDEPTSQLDPISAENIINTIRRLNEDFGITIIMVEHRLDKCFHIADRIIFMEQGEVSFNASPDTFLKSTSKYNGNFIPIISRVFKCLNLETVPKTVKEGKALIKKYQTEKHFKSIDKLVIKKKLIDSDISNNKTEKLLIKFKNVNFTYNKDTHSNNTFSLKNINMELFSQDFISIHGEVGAGKSTLLKLITLKLKPQTGKITINGENSKTLTINDIVGKIAYLSQNPGDYISQDTVSEEIKVAIQNKSNYDEKYIEALLKKFKLTKYINTHPRDLSTGEKQKLAIISLLILKPEIFLLDEPTRGLDLEGKKELGDILTKLNNQGITIILITHDIEFAYTYSKKSIILSKGELISFGETNKVLNQSYSYTTEEAKLFKGINLDLK